MNFGNWQFEIENWVMSSQMAFCLDIFVIYGNCKKKKSTTISGRKAIKSIVVFLSLLVDYIDLCNCVLSYFSSKVADHFGFVLL